MTQPTVEHIAKASTEAPTESGTPSSAAFEDLSRAYQELAVRNASNLTVAMKKTCRYEESGRVYRIEALRKTPPH